MSRYLRFVTLIFLAALGVTLAAADKKHQTPAAPTPITVVTQPAPTSPADRLRDDARFALEQRSVKAAELAARVAIIGSIISAAGIGGLIYSLWLNRTAALAAKASADSAVMDTRAWMKISPEIHNLKAILNSEGNYFVTMSVHVENIGRTPALDLTVVGVVAGSLDYGAVRATWTELETNYEQQGRAGPTWSRAIFPQEKFSQTYFFEVDKDSFMAANGLQDACLVVSCIYRLHDRGELKITPKVYQLLLYSPPLDQAGVSVDHIERHDFNLCPT